MNALYCVLLCAAFAVIELLIGGTRLLFSIPAYLVAGCDGGALAGKFAAASSLAGPWVRHRYFRFLAYILGRALVSPVAYIAWADEFMVLGALIVYLLTACYVTEPRRRLWILAFLLVIGLVNLAVGARQFVNGDNFMLFGFVRSARYVGRASGLYVCPDHLAFFLEIVGCLALSAAIWARASLWVRLMFGYGALCLFGGLLTTGSRGGFISAAAGLTTLTIFGLVRLRRSAPHHMARALLVVAVAVVLAAVGIKAALARSALLKSRAQYLVSMQDVRPKLWKAGLKQFVLSPVFGTGAATYVYYGRRLRDPSVQDDPIRTHNDYLELLAEYGAVGGVGLLVFLGVHVWNGSRAYRLFAFQSSEFDALEGGPGGSTATAWNIGSLSAVAVVMAHSVVDFNLHIPANTLLTAFVFGVLANPGRPLSPASEEPLPRLRWRDWWPRLALPILGLVLIVTGAPRLPGEYYCEKARVALRDHRLLEASRLTLKGLAHETRNPQLFFYLGEARLSLAGEGPDTPLAHSFRAGADEAYRRGLALAPYDTPLLLRHAQILTVFGNYAEAQQVFEQALLWDPNSALVQTYYGYFLQRTGRPAEAKLAYSRALQLSPNAAAATGLDQVSKLGLGSN